MNEFVISILLLTVVLSLSLDIIYYIEKRNNHAKQIQQYRIRIKKLQAKKRR
jgi:hypothetical protein